MLTMLLTDIFYFRYLKRGVNENGRVANDVETEQIVFEDVPEGFPMQISSVVQNRGSIPLFWSQETSRLNIKPDIICMLWHLLLIFDVVGWNCLDWRYFVSVSKRDQRYEATRLHFENLVNRYGNPIIILNLIKVRCRFNRCFNERILNCVFPKFIHYFVFLCLLQNVIEPKEVKACDTVNHPPGTYLCLIQLSFFVLVVVVQLTEWDANSWIVYCSLTVVWFTYFFRLSDAWKKASRVYSPFRVCQCNWIY